MQSQWRTAVKGAAALVTCSCEHGAPFDMQQGNGSLVGNAHARHQQPARSALLRPQDAYQRPPVGLPLVQAISFADM